MSCLISSKLLTNSIKHHKSSSGISPTQTSISLQPKMAVELCSDDLCLGLSPRISFSHDISQTGIVPVEQYVRSSTSSSSMDFDFCVFRESFDQESSSADELFFNGKILPIEIKRRMGPPRKAEPPKTAQPLPTVPPPQPLEGKNERLEGQKKSNSKVFWKFKRSSSLNCGSGYARTLCPLPLLSRSNSTGSSSPIPKHHNHKSSSSYSASNQKPPLKKSHAGSNSYSINGVKINPVLNVSPASIFGIGSMFSHGRDKNKK